MGDNTGDESVEQEAEDEFMAALGADTDLSEVKDVTANVTDNERCEWCGDEGWVELDWKVIDQGITYEGFLAPCIFCEYGTALGECIRTGTNRYFGTKPAREEPWRAHRDIALSYPTTSVLHKAINFRRGLMTFQQYVDSDVGQQDPHLAVLRRVLQETRQRRMQREDTPRQAVTDRPAPRPPAPPPTPAGPGLGAFARLAGAGGTVDVHTTPDDRSDT